MKSLSFWTVGDTCLESDPYGQDLILDLSAFDFIEPFGAVYVGLFLRYHWDQNHPVRLVPPIDPRVGSYLSRIRFFGRIDAPDDKFMRQMPNAGSWTSLNDMIEKEPASGFQLSEGTRRSW